MTKPLTVNQIQPLAGFALVKPSDTPKQTSSGIYLPDNAEEKPQHGQVLAVGGAAYQDGQKVEPPVSKGDLVIYKKWGGNEIKVEDVEYQILKFEDVLAVVK